MTMHDHAMHDHPFHDHPIAQLARERIVVLDGAMGTEIQTLGLSDEAFRGDRFCDHGCDLAGNSELLTLTQPDAMRDIHLRYLLAGADIVETNTFSANRVSQSDYGTIDQVVELNEVAARLAREAAEEAQGRDGRRRFVAGAVGPTNVTLSLSPKVEDPGYRATTFSALADAYQEQVEALLRGGVDAILLETIFDTLNAKAAIVACRRAMSAQGIHLPLMISGTITDRSGRTLSGQTPAAFWQSIRHAKPLTVGLNCALGAEEMRPHLLELATVADTLVCAYPNAGLPNELGGYDETPEQTAAFIGEFADAGLVNVVGGCCGTTPAHIGAVAAAVEGKVPRGRADAHAPPRTVGSRALRAHRRHPVRQRRRAHQHHRVGEVPAPDQGQRVRRGARGGAPAGRERRADHRRQHGRRPDRRRAGDDDVPQPDRIRARHRPRADHDRLVEVRGDRGRPAVRPGQADRELDLDEGGRGVVPRAGPYVSRLRRGRHRDGLRRGGPGRHGRTQGRHRPAGLSPARRRGRLPARGHHHRPQHLRRRDRHRGAQPLRARLHRGDEADHRRAPVRQHLRRRVEPVVLVPRQRAGPRSDALGVPAEGRRGGHAAWASSTPASSPCTTRSIPNSASSARTSCSPVVPTPPSGCSTQPPGSPATAPRLSTPLQRSGVRGTSSAASTTRSSTASPCSSRTTSKRRAPPPIGPST